MANYVYDTATGALYSWTPNDTDQVAAKEILDAKGLTLVSGIIPLDTSHAWDPATKSVISVTPAPIPKPIATGKWIMRFTAQEFAAISASTDPQVQQFMYALNHTTQVDLSDPLMTQGAAYLISINLLQTSRLAAVMA